MSAWLRKTWLDADGAPDGGDVRVVVSSLGTFAQCSHTHTQFCKYQKQKSFTNIETKGTRTHNYERSRVIALLASGATTLP